jgi:hypothetical protein
MPVHVRCRNSLAPRGGRGACAVARKRRRPAARYALSKIVNCRCILAHICVHSYVYHVSEPMSNVRQKDDLHCKRTCMHVHACILDVQWHHMLTSLRYIVQSYFSNRERTRQSRCNRKWKRPERKRRRTCGGSRYIISTS